MKRLYNMLALILALAIICLQPLPALGSAETDRGGLTMEELDAWVDSMVQRAMLSSASPASRETEDGYELAYDFATFYLDTPAWTKDSAVNAIVVTGYETECPRLVGISDTHQAVLDAYANENPGLVGSRDFAVLYLSDNSPEEVLWGWVQRDGQQINAVQYAVQEQLSDEEGAYTDCGLLYSLTQGYVTAVRAYGLSALVSRQELEANLAELNAVKGDSSYFAYPQSALGTDLNPFEREDLLFSGLDFLTLTPEAAISELGPFETETWFADDNGDWLRIVQWSAAEITFTYDPDKVFQRVDTMAFSQRGLEGPRAVMVGDSLSSVLMRFRHSDGAFDGGSIEVLYGDGKTPPFGLAEYSGGSATLYYAFQPEGVPGMDTVALYMIFTNTVLSEMFLYRL